MTKSELKKIIKECIYQLKFKNSNKLVLETLYLENTGKDFYDELSNPNFKYADRFKIEIPLKLLHPSDTKGYNTTIDVNVPVDMSMITRYIDTYVSANVDLKKKYNKFAYWYNNFNKLIFSSMSESDACLFLSACAFTSANTALDQNILEAAKLFSAIKSDFINGKTDLLKRMVDSTTGVKGNVTQKDLDKLKKFIEEGSAYAALLAPKLLPGEVKKTGRTKGSPDVFSEITVSNAKIPNFNKFVSYYLNANGEVTKQTLMQHLKAGSYNIGGTKIFSFFINLVDPDYKWSVSDETGITPATIDRWMIRVFFHNPLREILDIVQRDSVFSYEDPDSKRIRKSGGVDKKTKNKDSDSEYVSSARKTQSAISDKVINDIIMKMFGNDSIRQNLVRILNITASKAGLSAQQLQALAWVQIREEFGEPAAKFANFEDVMAYVDKTEAAIDSDLEFLKQIHADTLFKQFNQAIKTINVLTNTPRFKFTGVDTVAHSIKNRNEYIKIFKIVKSVKPESDPFVDDRPYVPVRIGIHDDDMTADIFRNNNEVSSPIKKGKGKSSANDIAHVVHTAHGNGRAEVIKNALRWIKDNI